MKTSNIILIAVYVVVTVLVLLVGVVYPDVKTWSYWAAGVWVLHGVLAVIMGVVKMADAGRLAACSWLTFSAFLCSILLLGYFRTEWGGWLLLTAALGGLTLVVTLTLVLMLKPNSATGR